jgi:hypothetical protein
MKARISRLGELLENSSHARRFSGDWYAFRAPRGRRFGSPTIKPIEAEDRITPISRAVTSPREEGLEWQAMEEEIKAASSILKIENDEEAEDFIPYARETLDRATRFLTRQMIHAHSARVIGMGVPKIGPADHGSIDLYWEKIDRTLLINFPNGVNVANYYGKKSKSEISGRFDPSEARVELVSWLADR